MFRVAGADEEMRCFLCPLLLLLAVVVLGRADEPVLLYPQSSVFQVTAVAGLSSSYCWSLGFLCDAARGGIALAGRAMSRLLSGMNDCGLFGCRRFFFWEK